MSAYEVGVTLIPQLVPNRVSTKLWVAAIFKKKILLLTRYIFLLNVKQRYVYEQTNAHLIDCLSYCSLFIAPACFNANTSHTSDK